MMIGGRAGREYANQEERKFSSVVCTDFKKTRIVGESNAKSDSTSYVERQNLNKSMQMKRFTTNAFEKKSEIADCSALFLLFLS